MIWDFAPNFKKITRQNNTNNAIMGLGHGGGCLCLCVGGVGREKEEGRGGGVSLFPSNDAWYGGNGATAPLLPESHCVQLHCNPHTLLPLECTAM